MTYQNQRRKKKEGDNDNDDGNTKMINQAVKELLKLAGNVDNEGELMASVEEDDDNDEGWINEHEEMIENELRELSASIAPVKLLLTKSLFGYHCLDLF